MAEIHHGARSTLDDPMRAPAEPVGPTPEERIKATKVSAREFAERAMGLFELEIRNRPPREQNELRQRAAMHMEDVLAGVDSQIEAVISSGGATPHPGALIPPLEPSSLPTLATLHARRAPPRPRPQREPGYVSPAFASPHHHAGDLARAVEYDAQAAEQSSRQAELEQRRHERESDPDWAA